MVQKSSLYPILLRHNQVMLEKGGVLTKVNHEKVIRCLEVFLTATAQPGHACQEIIDTVIERFAEFSWKIEFLTRFSPSLSHLSIITKLTGLHSEQNHNLQKIRKTI
jgi:hypothetical protein